jgi:integrase
VKALRGLARKAELLDPDSVKAAIARLQVTEARKENLVTVYALFCKENSIPFNPPRYHRIDKVPFIPLEGEVDQLIAGMGRRHSTYLQGLKELGCRAGELWNLKWDDLDLEAKTVNITPEKGSSARQLKISNKLVGMMNTLPRKGKVVFGGGSLDDFARWFYMKRAELANKLNNPRMRKIGFKTLRHWKASTLYRQTRDILLVKQTLGHRDIRNTLVYTHLLNDLDTDYVCKTARTLAEASALIEAGFDYVTEFDGMKLFRKRK